MDFLSIRIITADVKRLARCYALPFRDPDGNLVDSYTPVSAGAIRKFG